MSKEQIDDIEYVRKNLMEGLITPPKKMKKSIKLESSYPLWKRIWMLIKNPFTYIFCGYVEY